eukprot:265958-Amphidinium_carterae.2
MAVRFSHDSRANVETPFEVEVVVGPESPDVQHFTGTARHEKHKQTIHAFTFASGAYETEAWKRQSRELFTSSTDFTQEDLDTWWQAHAWSTYMWQYIYDTLRTMAGGGSLRAWD